MKGIYQKSRELKELIEGHGWQLYDSQQPKQKIPFAWHLLEKIGPASQFEVGHNYIFAPKQQNGQSLRDAYAVTKGLGPSLRIENPDDKRWAGLYVQPKSIGTVALFSRLFFEKEFVVASSPQTTYLPDPDAVAVKYENLIDTFQKYFWIVSPDEFGLSTPIPMPSVPESN